MSRHFGKVQNTLHILNLFGNPLIPYLVEGQRVEGVLHRGGRGVVPGDEEDGRRRR